VFLATDASDLGYGAQIGRHLIQGLWTARQRRWSINRRELFVILILLCQFIPTWNHQTVLCQTDNTTVVAVLNRGGTTKSIVLLELAGTILSLAHQLHIRLVVHHLPGRFNTIPDALSRAYPDLPEWHLHPPIARSFWTLLGAPTIDLFASDRSYQVPSYVTFNITDQAARWIDAFSRAWNVSVAWVFPPPPLIPQVLSHLQTATGHFYMTLPYWSNAWWLPQIQELSCSGPHPVPDLNRHLIDLCNDRPPPDVDRILLQVWTICLVRGSKTTCTHPTAL
jgi:hypothetical protein